MPGPWRPFPPLSPSREFCRADRAIRPATRRDRRAPAKSKQSYCPSRRRTKRSRPQSATRGIRPIDPISPGSHTVASERNEIRSTFKNRS
jgi:hypothetical protein